MEIVKEGDSSWNMKVTCQGYYSKDYPCFSELIVSKEDIVHLSEDMANIYGFVCPVCHQFTRIDSNLLPYSVQKHSIGIARKKSLYYINLSEEGKKISDNAIIY